MKEIKYIDFTRARNAEHYQLHSDNLSVITPEFSSQMEILPLYEEYKCIFDIEKTCFLRNRDYKETTEVRYGNERRKHVFRYIKQTIFVGTLNPEEEIRAAANRLAFSIKPYTNLTRLSHAKITASITEFVQTMQKPESMTDIAMLGLTDSIVELGVANNNFNAVYKERSDQLLVRKMSESMKSIRPRTDAAYRALADAINILYKANELVTKNPTKREAMEAVIDSLNAFTVQLKDTLARAGLWKNYHS